MLIWNDYVVIDSNENGIDDHDNVDADNDVNDDNIDGSSVSQV